MIAESWWHRTASLYVVFHDYKSPVSHIESTSIVTFMPSRGRKGGGGLRDVSIQDVIHLLDCCEAARQRKGTFCIYQTTKDDTLHCVQFYAIPIDYGPSVLFRSTVLNGRSVAKIICLQTKRLLMDQQHDRSSVRYT